jgi:hypothetical protein
MHRLLKPYFALLFFTQIAYSDQPHTFDKRKPPLLTMTLFQANLGWADFYAPNKMTDFFNPSESTTHNFSASSLHVALNITDLVRVPSAPTWILGARLGAQIFSNLKDNFTTTTSSAVNQDHQTVQVNQTYSLSLPGGAFGDFIAFKTFQEEQFYASAFAGVAYDRYRFQGYQNVLSGVTRKIRNDSLWAAGARLGAGLGIQLKGNMLVGIEYTHRFKQSIYAQANSVNYPYEYRSHRMHITGDSVDLIFSRALYDR